MMTALLSEIGLAEGVSVTVMRNRLCLHGVHRSRQRIRAGLRRAVRYGILRAHPRGGKDGGRVLYTRAELLQREAEG